MFFKLILTTAVMSLLASGLPLREPNQREIKDFVENCYYKIGIDAWKSDPGHECSEIKRDVNLAAINYTAKYKSLFDSMRAVIMAQTNRQVIAQQADDMQLAIECALHMKIPTGYTTDTYAPVECAGLWNGKWGYDFRTTQIYQLVKYFGQLNWIQYSVQHSEDKKAALECFRDRVHCPPRTTCLTESCMGITWGTSSVNESHTRLRKEYLRQLKKIDHFNNNAHFVAVTRPNLAASVPEMVALASVDHKNFGQFDKDFSLVRDCFLLEHVGAGNNNNTDSSKNNTQCEGISYGRPEKVTTLREAHLLHYWSHLNELTTEAYYPYLLEHLQSEAQEYHANEPQVAAKERKQQEESKQYDADLQAARNALSKRIVQENVRHMRYYSQNYQ